MSDAAAMMDVDSNASTSTSLDVLRLTNEARMEHGLRHQDYHRYRQYCTTKIQKVRKLTGNKHENTSASSRKKGKGKAKAAVSTSSQATSQFAATKITSESVRSNPRALEILLFESERSWSYAMALKRESAEEPRKRHHLVKRLKRAAQSAGLLVDACNDSGVDAASMLDARAYATVMAGYLSLEAQEWSAALDKFAEARTIYEKLCQFADGVKGSASIRERQALCEAAIDTIDPNIRFCAYNLKIRGASSGGETEIASILEARSKVTSSGLTNVAAQVEKHLAQGQLATRPNVAAICWRGRTAPSTNGKLVELLNATREAEEGLSISESIVNEKLSLKLEVVEARLQNYWKILGFYRNAAKLAAKDLKEDAFAAAKVKSSKSEEMTSNLQYISSRISYARYTHSVNRDILLLDVSYYRLTFPFANDHVAAIGGVKRSPKHEGMIAASDEILATLHKLSEIDTVSNDATLTSIVATKTNIIKSRRSACMALLLAREKRYLDAYRMFERAGEHLTLARSGLTGLRGRGATSLVEEDRAEVDWCISLIGVADVIVRRGLVTCHARITMEDAMKVDGVVEGVKGLSIDHAPEKGFVPLLLHRMDQFIPDFDPENPRLVDFPPIVRPVPCKPIFFDIVGSMIDYPEDVVNRVVGDTPSSSSAKKDDAGAASSSGSGIGGFLSGIWGRK